MVSFACKVSVTPLPELTEVADAVMSDCATEMVPGVTVSVGEVVVTVTPPMVALIEVAVPATTPVNEAVYVPLAASVVAETDPVDVPPVFEKTTVEPPTIKAFPAASLAVNVRTTELPEATVALPTLTSDCAGEIAPGVTCTVGKVVVTELEFKTARIEVAEPAMTPVKFAVYVPSPLSVTAPKVPVEVPPLAEKVTVAPPVVSVLPDASLAVNFACVREPD